MPVANLSIEHQREAGADGSAFLTAYDKWSPQSSFVPLVFLGFAVFHFNPAMPQNLPYCTILNRKKQTVVEFSCYHHDSPQNACQHLFDSSTHTRIFLQCHFSPLVDLINSATEKLHIFHLYLSGKKTVSLFASALPPSASPPSLLSSVVFALFLQCAPVHRKMLWLLKVRLLYWSTESKCMFPFVWHEQHTSPDKHTVHSNTMCIKGRQFFALQGWEVKDWKDT